MTPARMAFWFLGAAWGLVLALPIARRARHVQPATRAALLGPRASNDAIGRSAVDRTKAKLSGVGVGVGRRRVGAIGRVVGALRAQARARSGAAELARELPVVLDLLGVAVGAGCTPYLAVEVAVRWSPPRTSAALAAVLRACSLGVTFESALDDAARAAPLLRPVADALLASERLGAPVGPVLARLADEERTALRRRAEAHARRIPVRLLFPLVFLVLPAFVLLTVVPGLAAGIGRL
jgi:pilus assembly protein TadC